MKAALLFAICYCVLFTRVIPIGLAKEISRYLFDTLHYCKMQDIILSKFIFTLPFLCFLLISFRIPNYLIFLFVVSCLLVLDNDEPD
jgi:hypothetical protein